jgi:hypothetical protein
METDSQNEETPLEGLSNAHAVSLERFPIRTRESSVTLSAWRLGVATDDGEGSIFLIEISPDRRMYRGDGIFLGWLQRRLERVYRELQPATDDGPLDLPQLG